MNQDDRLGPYRLLRRLGEGGMGVVHLALDPHGRQVAVKVLRPEVAGDDTARRRLSREVETMRRVRNPYIAEVLDADVTGHRPYIVTRYVPGKPLDDLIKHDGPLTVEGILKVAYGVADALAAVHAAGVIHRDLKPGNVLMLDGEPVLIDFGIAQAVDSTRLTQTGMFIGTPGYLAPEIIEGHEAGPEVDVHAWAGTLLYAATGLPPFGKGTLEMIFFNITSGKANIDAAPAVVQPVLRAAFHRDPSRRPRAVELREQVARLMPQARRPRVPDEITTVPNIDDQTGQPIAVLGLDGPPPAPRPPSTDQVNQPVAGQKANPLITPVVRRQPSQEEYVSLLNDTPFAGHPGPAEPLPTSDVRPTMPGPPNRPNNPSYPSTGMHQPGPGTGPAHQQGPRTGPSNQPGPGTGPSGYAGQPRPGQNPPPNTGQNLGQNPGVAEPTAPRQAVNPSGPGHVPGRGGGDPFPTVRVTGEDLRRAGLSGESDIPTRLPGGQSGWNDGDLPTRRAGEGGWNQPRDGDLPTRRVSPEELRQSHPNAQQAFFNQAAEHYERTPQVHQPKPAPFLETLRVPPPPPLHNPGARPGAMLQRSRAYGVAGVLMQIALLGGAAIAPTLAALLIIPSVILFRAADIAQPQLNGKRQVSAAAGDVFRVLSEPAALVKSAGATIGLIFYGLILGIPVTLLLTVLTKMDINATLGWGVAVALWTICAGPAVEAPTRQVRRTLASLFPTRGMAIGIAAIVGVVAVVLGGVALLSLSPDNHTAGLIWGFDLPTLVDRLTELRKSGPGGS
ncbi:serine/threonine protein kinase [Herbidospora cretacea]|uniref:serine/threonine protein kinase n=1 Tax=Herbidospora cretacea TaxID=28444 RepID=UPI0009EE747A|nr:serine/threonine-protein kinase [Herbidospora cretacea]